MISPDDLLRAREFLIEGERLRIGDIDRQGHEQIPERSEVEPYLTALFQAEHMNLLLGSGLTIGTGALLGDGPNGQMNASMTIGDPTLGALIEGEAVRSAQASGRGAPNCQRRSKVEPKRSPKSEPVRCHYSSTAPRVTDGRLVSPELRSR